ncbi:DsbA family protein [Curvivirga aplysinae]|uniref:DsbA family protein n=1 Tax=Curvivirga aplysinae TaxID=2529852 RepID=UPI001C3FA495|nr:DsbA family protein [Curvivirga aplysinae]
MGSIKSKFFNFTAASAILLSSSAFTITAQAQDISDISKEQLEEIIHNYLMENPEVMIRSLDAYYKEQEELAAAESAKTLEGLLPAIKKSDEYPVAGNPDGKVTMVEFFDYNCGYCKRVLPQVNNIIENDDDVRVLFIELPILSPTSVIAAKAALAADMQGKYMDFHVAMMSARGGITEKRVFQVADSVGLDVEKLKVDMESDEVTGKISRNRQVAQMLNLSGTPAFIIGNEIVRGAIGEDAMLGLVKKAKEES